MADWLLTPDGTQLLINDGESVLITHDFRDSDNQPVVPDTLQLRLWDQDSQALIIDENRNSDIAGGKSNLDGAAVQLLANTPRQGEYQVRRVLTTWTWASGARENSADRKFGIKRIPAAS